MDKKILCLLLCLVCMAAGCVRAKVAPVRTIIADHPINAPGQKVFEAALVVAQLRNLDVAVLERQSGLIRLESQLTATQMDEHCEYPYVHDDSNEAWDTFENWNARSLRAGAGAVRGKVSLTLLITERGSASNINVRSNWTAHNNTETINCNSKGDFESAFMDDLKKRF